MSKCLEVTSELKLSTTVTFNKNDLVDNNNFNILSATIREVSPTTYSVML